MRKLREQIWYFPQDFLKLKLHIRDTRIFSIKDNSLIRSNTLQVGWPGSVVGIATAYGLDGPGIESRLRARFSAPVQIGPEAHPASCTMGTGSFPGIRCGRDVTLTTHPLLVPRSKIK